MTDAPSIPAKLRLFGGSLHDWLNTGFVVLLAVLYIARCEGITIGAVATDLVNRIF